jgi:predicted SnoaL-like aldol condensation-catalyzing enzyme
MVPNWSTLAARQKMNSFSRSLLPALLLAAAVAGGAHGAEQNAKEMVTAFYKMVFYDHKVADAFKTYVGASYRQHNPLVPDGIEPSVAFLSKRFEVNPRATNEIKRVIADGDLVAVHVHSRSNDTDRGRAIVDIFRVENGKIVEHWDVIQPVPENAQNGNTMF